MVELAESVPGHEQLQKTSVQYLYAFGLSRRNQEGDRDKAITILEKVHTYFIGIQLLGLIAMYVCMYVCMNV